MRYVMTMEEISKACADYVAQKINQSGKFEVSIIGEVKDNEVKSIRVEVSDGENK